ncbi:MAG: diguanylate cyclase [Herminiimonas sp.]|nr:diguanylate cyclase [Herminiimonas sp.]
MSLRLPFRSIATNLALWFALSSILLTVIVSQVIEQASTASLRKQIGEKLADLAYQTTDKLDQGMFERYREVQLMASRNSFTDPRSPLAVRQALIDQTQDSYQYYAWIGITDTKGHVLVSTKHVLAGVDVSARPWFADAIRGANHVGDLHEAKLLASVLPPAASGEPLRFVDIAFPYVGSDGKLAGVLGTHLSWEWARTIEQSVITPSVRRSHIDALIVGRDGTVLLGPPALQGTRLDLPGLIGGAAGSTNSAVERFAGGKSYLVGSSKSQGHPPFPGFGWTVLVRQDVDEAFAPVKAIQQKVLWSGFAIAILFTLFGVFNARRVSRPLVQLADDVRRYRAGTGTRLRAPGTAYREIGELATSFLTLIGNLERNQDALKQLNASLEQRVLERTAALAKSEDRLRLILENSNDAFIAIGSDGRVTDWNRQAEQSFGWTPKQAIGRDMADLIVPKAYRDKHNSGFARFLKSGMGPVINNRIEITGMHARGHEIPIELSVAAFHDGAGYVANAFLRDITERKAAERRITDSEQRLRAIADHLPVLISCVDRNQIFTFANATFEDWLGVTPEQVVGMHMKELLGAALYNERRDLIDRALRGEEVVFDMASEARGKARHVHTTYVPNLDPQGVANGFYTLTMDVSEIKAAEQQMAQLARHDNLTGLPNRLQLDEKLAEAVRRSHRSGAPMAVMFLDIDHFKRINDTFGHGAGDAVLREFATRLKSCVRTTDTVARLAGDEFIVVLENLHAAAEVDAVARKIIASLAAEVLLDGRPLYITTSIGIAYTDGAKLIPHELMAHADQALYTAKRNGRNTYFSDSFGAATSPPNQVPIH